MADDPKKLVLPNPIPPNLPPALAALYLTECKGYPITPATLAKKRCVGGGPPFRKIGARRTVYPVPGLDAHAEAVLGPELRSTSEAA